MNKENQSSVPVPKAHVAPRERLTYSDELAAAYAPKSDHLEVTVAERMGVDLSKMDTIRAQVTDVELQAVVSAIEAGS